MAFLRAARAGNIEKVLNFLNEDGDINTSNAVSSSFKFCSLQYTGTYDYSASYLNSGFIRALEILENRGKFLKPWKSLETLEKPWNFFYEALENLTELS